MTNEEVIAWSLGASSALYAANYLRLKIASYVIDNAIKRHQPRLEAFEKFKPAEWKEPAADQKKILADLETALNDNSILRKNATELRIPLPHATPEILESSEKYSAFIQNIMDTVEGNYASIATFLITKDVLTDAILNEALLRAFPESAAAAGAGEVSDFVLGSQLKELLDKTGIIDLTADFLTNTAHILSEQATISIAETAADPHPHLAIFSLIDIANRERKLIQAGHSTPGESLQYGLLEYGGALAATFAGAEFGAGIGAKGELMTGGASGGFITLISTIFGAIAGGIGAKATWRKLLKREIEGLSTEYRSVAHQAKRDLEAKKADVLEKTEEVAKKSFGAYTEIVRSCPDLRQRTDLGVTANNLSAAFRSDIETARAAIRSQQIEVESSIKKPGSLCRVFGANWEPELKRRIQKIADGHAQPFNFLETTLNENIHLEKIFLMAATTPIIRGGASEAIYKNLPGEIEQIIHLYKDDVVTWSGRCSDAWKSAGKQTVRTLEEQQNIFKIAYDALKRELEYRQRQVYHKAARLTA